MFDAVQKEVAIAEAVSIPAILANHLQEDGGKKARIFLSALVNYIEKTSPISSDYFTELKLDGNETVSELSTHMQRLFVHMVSVGVEDNLTARMYSTGDVARFFGVSVMTVNNWINQGRIIGVEKASRHKRARIPESAIYISSLGERITIKEAAELYEQEQKRTTIRSLSPTEELQEIVNSIVYFEKKYGGEYKDTLAQKSELTSQEERDAAEWSHLLNSIEDSRE